MKHHISLDYTLPEGGLKPYFEALQRGDVLASKCASCGDVAYPVRVLCQACGTEPIDWVSLPGTATVVQRTDGQSTSYALVRFTGADTLSTVALINPTSQARTGRLSVPSGDRPGLWLKLDCTPKEDAHV